MAMRLPKNADVDDMMDDLGVYHWPTYEAGEEYTTFNSSELARGVKRLIARIEALERKHDSAYQIEAQRRKEEEIRQIRDGSRRY